MTGLVVFVGAVVTLLVVLGWDALELWRGGKVRFSEVGQTVLWARAVSSAAGLFAIIDAVLIWRRGRR